MRVSEIFHSVQGEGIHAGIPMTFIRLQGCPFRCSYCDTEHAQDPRSGTEMTTGEAARKVELAWACITGGEPLLQKQALVLLVEELQGKSIEIETSGLLPIPLSFPFHLVDSWVMDIKCPSGREAAKTCWENIELLGSQDQVKFVVGTDQDLEYAKFVLHKYPGLPNVLISPVWGAGMEAKAVRFVMENGVRLSLQLHKYAGVR